MEPKQPRYAREVRELLANRENDGKDNEEKEQEPQQQQPPPPRIQIAWFRPGGVAPATQREGQSAAAWLRPKRN